MPVHRTPWNNFPNVAVHSNIATLKAHHGYADAKAGDLRAARAVVRDLVKPEVFSWRPDFIVPVVQLDHNGRWNAIPLAFADRLARLLGAKVVPTIVQDNIVQHTSADSISRIVQQPTFAGKVPKGSYLIVDDVVTLGSTIANLRGHIEFHGGKVAAASTIAAAIFSTKLAPDNALIGTLKFRFGPQLSVIPDRLGFSPQCLTSKEAHFLNGLRNLVAITNPLTPTHRVIKPSI